MGSIRDCRFSMCVPCERVPRWRAHSHRAGSCNNGDLRSRGLSDPIADPRDRNTNGSRCFPWGCAAARAVAGIVAHRHRAGARAGVCVGTDTHYRPAVVRNRSQRSHHRSFRRHAPGSNVFGSMLPSGASSDAPKPCDCDSRTVNHRAESTFSAIGLAIVRDSSGCGLSVEARLHRHALIRKIRGGDSTRIVHSRATTEASSGIGEGKLTPRLHRHAHAASRRQ